MVKKSKKSTHAPPAVAGHTKSTQIAGESIKGTDDAGRFYNSHDALATEQSLHKDEFYEANRLYWNHGGCSGSNDDEAMTGDEGAIADGIEGLAFLDRFLSKHKGEPIHRFDHAVDLGAGAGRVTKLVLLKRYSEVRLVEGDEGWSKRSRGYLGRKRASRCSFSNQLLYDITEKDVIEWGEPVDLMWVQWTLQYLIDEDFVNCLRILSGGIKNGIGRFNSEGK